MEKTSLLRVLFLKGKKALTDASWSSSVQVDQENDKDKEKKKYILTGSERATKINFIVGDKAKRHLPFLSFFLFCFAISFHSFFTFPFTHPSMLSTASVSRLALTTGRRSVQRAAAFSPLARAVVTHNTTTRAFTVTARYLK